MRTAPRILPRRPLLLALAALASGACSRDQRRSTSEPPPAPAPAVAPGHPSAPSPAPAPAPSGDGLSGTVVETMDSGGYTYALLDRGGTRVWAAGPATKLTVGLQIGDTSGTLMTGFRSETLGRTFEQIYFVGAFPIAQGGGGGGQPAPAASPPPPAITPITPAVGGKTIAEVFEDKAALAGKRIIVRGKIVKLNNGIMGRNWLHLQDGTGTTGTNDLLVTTTATATLGDIVIARGTLALEKDFGGGYQYDVVVEDATLAAE